jgi:hypothetical protein
MVPDDVRGLRANGPCVLVFNPISGRGHLDSWNAIFVSVLLDRGWHVLALTPDAGALMARMALKDCAQSPRLQVLKWDVPATRFGLRAWPRRAWGRWDAFGDKYFYMRPGSQITPDMNALARFRVRVLGLIVPPLFRASHFVYARLRKRRGARDGRPALEADDGGLDPADFSLQMNAALRRARRKPAIVLNMYMDTYRSGAGSWRKFAAGNRFPWAGIRFVPTRTPQEGYYELPCLMGMCFLDERVAQEYAIRMPSKCFEHLPDVTETAVPERPSRLREEIERRAAGRKIVFLGGTISAQKNLARWYELIELADPRRWFFVQVGEILTDSLGAEDAAAVERVTRSPPENLLVRAEYLADERTFNEIVAASDVVFAVYREFRISSNMLCKAATFKKPVLVSDRYLVGERVTRYGIGLAVTEDSARSIHQGLLHVEANPIAVERFQQFCDDFNTNVLGERLDRFLRSCLHRGQFGAGG